MLRWLFWQLAKRRFATLPRPRVPATVRSAHGECPGTHERFPPNAEPYERMAAVWDDYSRWWARDYAGFLAAAGAYYRRPVKAVLDLACGTGVLTRQLAARAESVVGLDVSEPMLREARSRTDSPRVRYARGDFRDFDLAEQFDAAVCGGDSLNYLGSAGELADVFRCVRRHLRPGGLFAFDAYGHRAFAAGGGRRIIATVGAEQFDVYFFYDPAARVGESRAVFPGAVERHRRVPLDEADVRKAAGGAGLEVVDHFHERPPLFMELPFTREFYVLRSG